MSESDELHQDLIDRCELKINKLKRKKKILKQLQSGKHEQICSDSSSDSEEVPSKKPHKERADNASTSNSPSTPAPPSIIPLPPPPIRLPRQALHRTAHPHTFAHASAPPANTRATTPEPATNSESDIQSTMVVALEKGDDNPVSGIQIHSKIVKLCDPILTKGLPKDDLDEILSKYPMPKNFPLLRAPQLNREMVKRLKNIEQDDKLRSRQKILGVATAAVASTLTLLLNDSFKFTRNNKEEIVRKLSRACRLLTNEHHEYTLLRQNSIQTEMPNYFTKIQKCVRDDTLFGHDWPVPRAKKW